ncbi:MAG: hypothetical protein M1827_001573 [Pycnora praestabilis]|nr:MAG: hypothetical protein M1827_001573 [Pycnora praestabilis]
MASIAAHFAPAAVDAVPYLQADFWSVSFAPISSTLTNGITLVADLYLPLFGLLSNMSFVPASLLDSAGNLVLKKTMREVGTKNVWGIGDLGNLKEKQGTVRGAQISYQSATRDLTFSGEDRMVKDYELSKKTMIFITMGKKYATGQIGG